MSQHTHKGHCQLCDRQQAVNNKTQRIAKHGYTKRWHFFSGTCPGSDHSPYELSAARIPSAVAGVEAAIDGLVASRDLIKQIGVDTPLRAEFTIRRALPKDKRRWGRDSDEHVTVWGAFAVESSAALSSGYVYERTQFVPDAPVKFQNGEVVSLVDSGELYRRGNYYSCTGPAEHAARWRSGEVACFELKIKQHETYRDWLQARFTTWTLGALQPVAKEVAA